MGRGARNALRLDALKQAFILNAPRSDAIDIRTAHAAQASGADPEIDASLAARQTNQKTKTAKARPQG